MTINMKLNDKYFNLILDGLKDIEIRLLDKKRSTLSIGDTIVFTNNDRQIEVIVKNLYLFNSFNDLLSEFDYGRMGFNNLSRQDALDELFSIYPESKVSIHKILCIEFKKI